MKIRGRASYAGTCRASSKTFNKECCIKVEIQSRKKIQNFSSRPHSFTPIHPYSFSIGTRSRTLRDRRRLFFSRDSSAFLLEKADIVRAKSSTSSICSRRANPRFLLLLYVRGKFENLKATATFLALSRADNEILRSNVRDAGIHHLPRGRWRRN